ncbi:putative entry exclusion protein TrbK-alt [Tardiphaga sp. 619_E2_N8_4]
MFSRIAVVTAAGAAMLVVAACAIQLRGDSDETASNSTAPQSTGTLEPSLARCQTVKPEQTATYGYCRRIWAENRRRFFGRTKSTAASDQSSELPPKDQSRIPQGYPSAPLPDSE